jgi:prepilin-type N-terminal cleavage/methylation domain-containing protein
MKSKAGECMRARHPSAFTLIELLAVLAIVGVVMAVGIPAFFKLTKSAALSSGAAQLSSTISLARQYAITHRERTFVLFPYSGTTTVAWTNRLYTAYSIVASNRSVPAANALYYVSKWQELPQGVVIVNANPLGTGGKGYDPDTYLQSMTFSNIPIDNINFGDPRLAYIEFRPTGMTGPCVNNNTEHIITLVEGIYESPNVTRISSNSASIFVSPLTGRIRIQRQ